MADRFFDAAFDRLMDEEGGFVNHTCDPGGMTKYGITKRSYPHLDIPTLTLETAKDIYRKDFWDKHAYGQLSDVDVAAKVLSLSVNMGPKQAHTLLQRALRAVGVFVIDDGILGPKTWDALDASLPSPLLTALRSEAAGYYRLLSHKNTHLTVFLKGWLNRAYA